MADRAEARSAGPLDDDDMGAEFTETCDKAAREHSLEISQAEIARLALLPDLEYRILERKAAAKRLGIATSVLDKYVEAARPKDDSDNQQGRAVRFADIQPWPNPVDGNSLAAALAAAIKQHVVLLDDQADTIALWVLHSWLVNEFYISPRLAITSPTKGCGKTTVLRLLNIISRRPKRTGSISPPRYFVSSRCSNPPYCSMKLKSMSSTAVTCTHY